MSNTWISNINNQKWGEDRDNVCTFKDGKEKYAGVVRYRLICNLKTPSVHWSMINKT